MREIKYPRVWDDVLLKMLYSKFEQYDDMIGFRFEQHLETENLVYMWPTGLKDKNGKEIYEGDIILLNGRLIRHVEYDRGAFVLVKTEDTRLSPIRDYITDYRFEVIGNIYQHPHLLGGDVYE